MRGVIRLTYVVALVIAGQSAWPNPLRESYTQWRQLTASRLVSSWQIYLRNHPTAGPQLQALDTETSSALQPVLAESSSELAKIIGLDNKITSDWIKGKGRLSVEIVSSAARRLDVQPWWLMGLDRLKQEYDAEKIGALTAAQYGSFLPFVTLAYLNEIPWRPAEHIYEPMGCEILLRSNLGSGLEPETEIFAQNLRHRLGP